MKIRNVSLQVAFLAWMLAGCVTPSYTNIVGTDRGVSTPSVRISGNWTGKDEARGAPSEWQGGIGLEFESSRESGSASQQLSAGQDPVLFQGTTFAGPQNLQHEFDFWFFSFMGRYRAIAASPIPIGVEILVGLGYPVFDLRVSSATQRAEDTLSYGGPTAAIGGVWIMQPGTNLHARYTAFNSVFNHDGYVLNVNRLEAFVTQTLGRHVAVRAGYGSWRMRANGDNRSDVYFKFSGPSLGLNLDF